MLSQAYLLSEVFYSHKLKMAAYIPDASVVYIALHQWPWTVLYCYKIKKFPTLEATTQQPHIQKKIYSVK